MPDIKHAILTGGCVCGAVRFKVNGLVRPVIACHCETCRRTSGHYWAATETYCDDLHLIEERGLKWFRSSSFAQRGFCAECGSSLFYRRDGVERISISAGAIDAPTGLALTEHICMNEASDYYTANPTISQRSDCQISQRWLLPPRSQ